MNNFLNKFNNIKNNKVFSFLLIILSIIIFFIFCIFLFKDYFNNSTNKIKKDPISGENLDFYQGTNSGEWDKYIKIYSLHFIKDNSKMQINSYNKTESIIKKFITFSYPNINTVSYKKNSIKEQNQVYEFEIVSDTKQTFLISVKELPNDQISIDFYNHKTKIFTYDESTFKKIYTNPTKLSQFLPKTFRTTNNLQYTINENLNGQYEISVESCGDQKIINQVKELANKWLIEINFNPEEISFQIPNYCDDDGHHHH